MLISLMWSQLSAVGKTRRLFTRFFPMFLNSLGMRSTFSWMIVMKIRLCLNSVCALAGDSSISMGSVNPSSMDGSLVLMIRRSKDTMNYVSRVFTNLTVTKSDELFSSLREFVQLALHCVRNLLSKFECDVVEFLPHC